MIRTMIVTVSYGHLPSVLPNPNNGVRSFSLSSGKPNQIAPSTWTKGGKNLANGHSKLLSQKKSRGSHSAFHQRPIRCASMVRSTPRKRNKDSNTLPKKRLMRVGECDRLRFWGGRPGWGGKFSDGTSGLPVKVSLTQTGRALLLSISIQLSILVWTTASLWPWLLQ